MDALILFEPNVEFEGLSVEHEVVMNGHETLMFRRGSHIVSIMTHLFVQFTAKIGWQLQPASSVATESICAL